MVPRVKGPSRMEKRMGTLLPQSKSSIKKNKYGKKEL
jgi:hypothetical protein